MKLYLFKNKDKNIDNISNLLEDNKKLSKDTTQKENTKDSLNEYYKEQFNKLLDEIIQ